MRWLELAQPLGSLKATSRILHPDSFGGTLCHTDRAFVRIHVLAKLFRIAGGVAGLPVPCVAAHILDTQFRMPAEYLFRS